MEFDSTATTGKDVVIGYGRQDSVDLKNFFENDDEYAYFAAVLYFSATESDGLPSADKLAGKLVARPFVKVDGEIIYGDASAPASIYDVAVAAWENTDLWNSLEQTMQDYLDRVIVKVQDAGLGA